MMITSYYCLHDFTEQGVGKRGTQWAPVSWPELAQADSSTPLSMSIQIEIFSPQLDIYQVCTWGKTSGLKIEV